MTSLWRRSRPTFQDFGHFFFTKVCRNWCSEGYAKFGGGTRRHFWAMVGNVMGGADFGPINGALVNILVILYCFLFITISYNISNSYLTDLTFLFLAMTSVTALTRPSRSRQRMSPPSATSTACRETTPSPPSSPTSPGWPRWAVNMASFRERRWARWI